MFKNRGELKIKTISSKNYIWVYFILFYALWSVRELWLTQYLDLINLIPQAVISALIKILIWIVPVFLLVWSIEKRNPFTYFGLRYHLMKGMKWTAWTAIIFVLCFFLFNTVVLNNGINLHINFHDWLNTVLLVGITEEIVFRGFILRKLTETFKFWLANVMTAILFVSIHFPIWLYRGLFEFPAILGSCFTAFILGLLFGYIYKKSKSLWSVIIIHSLYNFLVSVF